jgi:cytochrome c oxidase cbb3-type subunit 4
MDQELAMDINTLRSMATVISFAGFIGIVWWAWSKRRASDFEEAARLPFEQD